MRFNRLLLMALVSAVLAFGASAATCTWKGGKSTKINNVSGYYSSEAANWVDGVVPVEGDDVVFDGTATSDCRWNVDVTLGSWTQAEAFTRTVTIATVYDSSGFACLKVSGDVDLQGGKWTHLAQPSTTEAKYRLYAQVGGNLTVGAKASVSAVGLGYQKLCNPLTGAAVSLSGRYGGTHGGYSSTSHDLLWPYDSVTAPEMLGGRGSGYLGGGAIRLDVGGLFTVDGTVDASAVGCLNDSGAGGSVYVRAGSIAGAGSVLARIVQTGSTYPCGSGGRIAIVLTKEGSDFSLFDPVARCDASSHCGGTTYYGGHGTIYAETAADKSGEGWLIVVGDGRESSDPLTRGAALFGSEGRRTANFSRLSVTNRANVMVESGTLDVSKAVVSAYVTGTSASGFQLCDGGILVFGNSQTVSNLNIFADGNATVDCARVTAASVGHIRVNTGDLCLRGNLAVEPSGSVYVNAKLTVTGDLAVTGTVKRSTRSVSGAVTPDPSEIVVGGKMTISTTGVVTADKMGYATNGGPTDQVYGGPSGAHGGAGWQNNYTSSTAVVPFGSVREPMTGGGGGTGSAGGGILKLTVAGDLVNDGVISASSEDTTYYPGAGGSVNIRAKTLTGSGGIRANGGKQSINTTSQYGAAGGGRIAIRLTGESASFDDFAGTNSAWASHRVNYQKSDANRNRTGGAGTIWLKTAAQGEDEGTLLLENEYANMTHVNDTPLGTAFMANDLAYGDVLIGRSAKLKLCAGKTLQVSGVFSNGCSFVAEDASTVAFTGAGTSRVYGNSTFANLSCAAAGKTVCVAEGTTLAVSGVADFVNCTLTGDGSWNLVADGALSMASVSLGNCQVSKPVTIVNGTDLGGNSANVTFVTVRAGETNIWTGAAGTSWADAGNWSQGRTPIGTDYAVVPEGVVRAPVLDTDVEVVSLTVAEGVAFNLADKHLTVSNAVFAGSLVATGAAVLEAKGDLSVLGTVTPAASTVRLSGAGAQTLTVNGNSFSTIEVRSPSVSLTGDFTATTLSVGDGATAFDCTFADGERVTVDRLVVAGTTGARLRGATDGAVWKLSVNEAEVSNVTVSGSDASDGVAIVPTACTDGGDNVNWLFVDNRTHWDGSAWSDGEPTAEKDAVVDAGATLEISSAFAAKGFTVGRGASVKITATAAFAGSFVIEPDATVTWSVPGTIAGNLVLLKNATLTHAGNTTAEVNKLDLTVGGSGSVAAGAAITARGKGYKGANAGPGAKGSNRGASYGGRGYARDDLIATPCYGSILCPTNLGSCADSGYAGGGAIKILFGGSLRVDGEINAEGAPGCVWYTPSGGSIWLQATRIVGSGLITANGALSGDARTTPASGHSFGGGGRVAIYLAEAETLDDFGGLVTAYGGYFDILATTKGSPGTVYVQTAADAQGAGTVTVANHLGYVSYDANLNATDIPVVGNPKELELATIVLKNYATLYLTTNAVVGDIRIEPGAGEMSGEAYSRIKLNGHVLKVNSFAHPVSPNDAKTILSGDGGFIEWKVKGFMILVR